MSNYIRGEYFEDHILFIFPVIDYYKSQLYTNSLSPMDFFPFELHTKYFTLAIHH